MKTKILHIGCGNAYLKNKFEDIEEVRLDLCPWVKPDIILDICELKRLPACSFDGVWMSHVMEHVYEHQVDIVLEGIKHVLKDNGFLYIGVPDLRTVLREILDKEYRLDDVFYVSFSGVKVRPLDILYGYQEELRNELTYNECFNQHKTGFDADLMLRKLNGAGFKNILMSESDYEVKAIACLSEIPKWVERNFNMEEVVV